ncbi:MAG: putative glycoside hydrolase [Patescibacteria group bacterium]|jgi:hypothetical protein
MKRIACLLIIAWLFWPLVSRAAVLKNTYPRLANYFLKWEISDSEAVELSKWDLLIVDMETITTSRAQLLKIREANPQIIILAYLTPQEIINEPDSYSQAVLRQELAGHLNDGWWLKDSSGNKISNWPGTSLLNLANGATTDVNGYLWNDYLPEFVVQKIKGAGLFDGIFYDNIWNDISWLNNGDIDINGDGQKENSETLNRLWIEGVEKILLKTKALAGDDWLLMINGHTFAEYQKIINGLMIESFPSPWENNGSWPDAMKTYSRLPSVNLQPSLPIINVTDKNQANYRHFRYGLASALLGDGFYSFDYDVTNHGQTWWYDEYDLKLGPAQSQPYNLLNASSSEFKVGLWRRDFKYGTAIVNSTNQEQRYVFSREELIKIKGGQDFSFNTGLKINYLKLAPQDGIVLLKSSNLIKDSAFTNGYFFRVFSFAGQQVRNGFFSYLSSFPGSEEVIIADNGSQEISLSAGSGKVNLTKNGRVIASFKPYANLYKKQLNLAAQITDGYFRLLAVGPGLGGGPQVRLFTPDGKLKGSFFAYDQKFRGGVNVALGDVNGDGALEIITGPGAGLEPRVKVFNSQGKLETSWLAYDQKFRGGVNVALGDINGDGTLEIITGPGSGGGPQVRIFNSAGKALKSFFAYDQSFHGGIRVAASDINEDGLMEILVGINNF